MTASLVYIVYEVIYMYIYEVTNSVHHSQDSRNSGGLPFPPCSLKPLVAAIRFISCLTDKNSYYMHAGMLGHDIAVSVMTARF